MKNVKEHGLTDFRLVEQMCFRLLPVQILLAAIGVVNGMISSLFASNYVGAEVMSAVGLYGPIRLFVSAVGMMLFGGSQILFGKYMGKNQQEEIPKVFSLNIAISVLFGLSVTVVMAGAAAFDLTGVFAEDGQIRLYFNQYLLGAAVGILPQILGQQLSGFLSLENQTKRTTAASVVCVVSTLIMNYIFVVVLRMEAFGLAAASSIGMWTFCLVQSLYYFGGKSMLKPSLKEIGWRSSGQVFATGLPCALSNVYLMVRGIIVNALIVHYVGGIGLSAFAACNAFLDIFWAVPTGMCAVSRMLISVSVGEEDRRTLQDIMRVVFRRFIPLVAAMAFLLILAAEPMTRFYYRDAADPVFLMTVWGFRILPLCMPLSLICMHFVCYGQASDKQGLVHLLSVVDGVLAVALSAMLLIPALGILGVYTANVLNGVATTAVVVGYAWIRNGKFPRTLEELMVIPKNFGVPEEDRLDITVRSIQEVVSVSHRVQSFCLERGVDGRRAYFAALAVEEMAGNVVTNGFAKDRRPHSVDLRVAYKENGLILRIKDDCEPADPTELKEIIDPEDPAKNIGIRMVFSMGREISYQNILGMNALTVRI